MQKYDRVIKIIDMWVQYPNKTDSNPAQSLGQICWICYYISFCICIRHKVLMFICLREKWRDVRNRLSLHFSLILDEFDEKWSKVVIYNIYSLFHTYIYIYIYINFKKIKTYDAHFDGPQFYLFLSFSLLSTIMKYN